MRHSIFAVLLLAPGLASAQQSDFSAADVVRHFQDARGQEQKTRGVTIGATGFGASQSTSDLPKTGAASAATSSQTAASPYNLLITFEFNSDTLTARAKRNLEQFALALKSSELSGRRFALDGHTDASGSDDYNLALSQRRAQAVAAYLGRHGIDSARLEPRGYGETKPKFSNRTHPGNRRVEARLMN